MKFMKKRDLSDLSVVCHDADLDTYFKSIVKSNFCCRYEDSHTLFAYIFLKEKKFLQTSLQKFSSSST